MTEFYYASWNTIKPKIFLLVKKSQNYLLVKNLSELIHTEHKSSNFDPFNYSYSIAKSRILDDIRVGKSN